LPHREIFEFSIPLDAASLNRLGEGLKKFSCAEHEVLIWSHEETTLFKNRKEAEQADPANLASLGG
jgi:hypothetical protein